MRLAAVGDNCVDRLAPSGRALIGGNAVNVAVQWARLGHEAHYFGAVGPDAEGRLTRATLAKQGVEVARLVTRGSHTAFTEIEIAPDGERHMRAEDFGACAGYRPLAGDLRLLAGMDHVHIGWLDDGGAVRRALAAVGVSVSQDISVNARPEDLGVEGLALVFLSSEGDHAQARALAAALRRRGARDVVVTRGAAGSSVFVGDTDAAIPAASVAVCDTTGAGDSYIAGFLAALIGGAAPEAAGRRGAALAALTCRHEGGFPQDD